MEYCFVQHALRMPSRYSMLSGRFPSSLGVTHMGVPVAEDAEILSCMLSRFGYRTANFGKLHFLPHANRDHLLPHPAYGFDHADISDERATYGRFVTERNTSRAWRCRPVRICCDCTFPKSQAFRHVHRRSRC
jgi:arylsulfatase A-like enzyme